MSFPFIIVAIPMVDWLIIFEPVIVCCLSARLYIIDKKDRHSSLVLPTTDTISLEEYRRKVEYSQKCKLELEAKTDSEEVLKTIERTTVEKVVLIICPYCGAKNEQGILKCQKCKADL